jgi:hypothetical protein
MSGFRHRPDIVARHVRTQILALGALDLVAHLPGPWKIWPWRLGASLLLGWIGERLPTPTLEPRSGQSTARVLGLAGGLGGNAPTINTLNGLTFAANRVMNFADVSVGPGGVPHGIVTREVRAEAFDGAGQWIGPLPNPPRLYAARLLPGNVPLIEWVYSAYGHAAPPAEFRIYRRTDAADFNFTAPLATVAYIAGVTRYVWQDGGLSSGAVRYYTVRAASAAGKQSLIPRVAAPPATDYSSVPKARAVRVEASAGAPVSDPDVVLEVFDAR